MKQYKHGFPVPRNWWKKYEKVQVNRNTNGLMIKRWLQLLRYCMLGGETSQSITNCHHAFIDVCFGS